MDNKKIAEELVKIAQELVANKEDNERSMIYHKASDVTKALELLVHMIEGIAKKMPEVKDSFHYDERQIKDFKRRIKWGEEVKDFLRKK